MQGGEIVGNGLGLLGEALGIGLATSDFCYHVPEFGVRIHVDTKIGLPADPGSV